MRSHSSLPHPCSIPPHLQSFFITSPLLLSFFLFLHLQLQAIHVIIFICSFLGERGQKSNEMERRESVFQVLKHKQQQKSFFVLI